MVDILEASIVVPTYNERENIGLLIDKIASALQGVKMEVIVVDDHSPDGTADVVADYAQNRHWLKLVNRRKRRSLSGSVMEGFRIARGQILGVLDADLSHDPILLPQMIELVHNGVEVVIGSRRIPGGGAEEWPWFRRGLSALGNWLARTLLQLSISDAMSGYFVMNRHCYDRVRNLVNPRGYKVLLEFCVRGRPRSIQELPYIFRNRKQGYSKLSFYVACTYLVMLFELSFHTWFNRSRRLH